MKKGVRYLRFSSVGQSNGSIEWQDNHTAPWFAKNKVELIDTFIDAGHSAKTFDRPDMAKLTAFVEKHHKSVDFLVVDELSRFSRDAGEGLTTIKKLQKKFSIQIVSVCEGITFDYYETGNYFRTGLGLLCAENDNIMRTVKINQGVYEGKKSGRYIHGQPPFGYIKTGTGKTAKLEIHEEQAATVRYIYQAYLKGTPIYLIKREAKKLGFPFTSNSYAQKILQNPIYSGQQYVRPWRDMPGGIFPAQHDPIIDMFTWQQVQHLIRRPNKTKVIISDEMPLRGVLHCHCGRPLTGAPSRGRHGKYYNYYKCSTASAHNNIAATKAHDQLMEVLRHLSLPDEIIAAIKSTAKEVFVTKMQENSTLLRQKRTELKAVNTRIESAEHKWVDNQLTYESYNRLVNNYTQQRGYLQSQINQLSSTENDVHQLIQEYIDALKDLRVIYQNCTTLQKQEFLKLGFDNKLYYQNGIYRTPYILPIFNHNLFILNQKQLLILDKKTGTSVEVPGGGAERSRTAVQTYLPQAFYMLIPELFVGKQPEPDKPITSLAVWS